MAWRPGPAVDVAEAWDGAVAHSPVARWRLAGGKVLGSSTMTTRQMCWARRVEAGLTEEAGRRWGRAVARHSSVLIGGRLGGGSG
jgi:hypothetical protein